MGSKSVLSRSVHQITKIAPKSLAKWYNYIAPQLTAHHTTPHRTAPSLYINIYFNIKYIINNLITLVFNKNKKKV